MTGLVNNRLIYSTNYINLPAGTTAQRPLDPKNGDSRFNTSTGYGEIYSAAADQWLSFGTAPTLNVEYLVVAGGGGGGGGGPSPYSTGGTGGSGIVIIKINQ